MNRVNQRTNGIAASIAHDLNNVLTVINGYSELLLVCLDPADPNRPLVDEVRRAGARAAALTERLQHANRHRGETMPTLPAAPPPHEQQTVLLVEDDDSVLTLLRYLLQGQGYRVLDAASGQDALELCKYEPGPIDLLITDVVMPVMGGPQLAAAIVERFVDVRVLFVSGYTDEAIAAHGLAPDCVHFMQKPFVPSELVRKVREVLDTAKR